MNLKYPNIVLQDQALLKKLKSFAIREAYYQLVDDVKGKVDVLMTSETKIDDSFQTMQFHSKGYCIFGLYQN